MVKGQLHIEYTPQIPPSPTHLVVTTAVGQPIYIDLEHARATLKRLEEMLAACEASGGAATTVDGKMVDKPVVELARSIATEGRGS